MTLDLQKLAAAKLWLITAPPSFTAPDSPRDLPYLAQALYALTAVESDAIRRMSCDEAWRIYINPNWLRVSPVHVIGAELVHLLWHLLRDHSQRARSVGVDRTTAAAWRNAADITIEYTLSDDLLSPHHLPDASSFELDYGLSAEEYFALLSGLPADADGTGEPPDDDDEDCGSCADGIPRGHEIPANSDVQAVTTLEAQAIRRRVAIEYQDHIRQRGHQPGDDLRWIESILEPTVPWPLLLGGAVRRALGWAAGHGDYTYTRPSRRASSNPRIVLPGQQRRIPRVAMIVDTSGSVDDDLLERALGEVDSVIAALGVPGTSVNVYSVDAAVHNVSKVRRARDIELVGAGGTDLRIGLIAAERQRPRPDIIIIFTDGDTPWPATPPIGASVIAAILGRTHQELPPTPPWVLRVECLVD